MWEAGEGLLGTPPAARPLQPVARWRPDGPARHRASPLAPAAHGPAASAQAQCPPRWAPQGTGHQPSLRMAPGSQTCRDRERR